MVLPLVICAAAMACATAKLMSDKAHIQLSG